MSWEMLTERQLEVLKLMAQGRANKQIASDLGISVKTVEKHRNAIYRHLEIHFITEAVCWAIALNLIPVPTIESLERQTV